MTLQQIGDKQGTDKGSIHGYLSLYQFLFSRYTDPNILEIGIQFGNSMKTWREYFPEAVIVGIDAVDNGVSFPDMTVLIGDAYTPEMVARFGNSTFEIIIEDGNHLPQSQAWTCRHYAPLLSPDGLLIIEDVPNPAVFDLLSTSLPAGFSHCEIDLRQDGRPPDSLLFVAWRQ